MRRTGGSSGRWLAARWVKSRAAWLSQYRAHRRWMTVLVCCAAVVLGWAALVGSSAGAAGMSGSGSPAGSGVQSTSLDLHSSPFESAAASGAQSSQEAQQAAAAAQARRNSPAAVAARAASRTKFAHLGTARAEQVAREAFPETIERLAGGPPQLPAGQRIARYITANAAQLDLSGGKHAVVESMEPMAIEGASEHLEPVDLSLTKTGNVYESVRPVKGVLIPRRSSEGVQLLEAGVSLTPVDAQGSPLGGSEGALDGASVIYANTQTDTDTVMKPTTEGVEADTVLRAVDSPGQLYFHLRLPVGARLDQTHVSDGPVSVVENGRTIAQVRPPSATDAAGTAVPVSMSVRGDLLALSVGASTGEYQYPIEVDPELRTIVDSKIGPSECVKEGEAERASSNWCIQTRSGEESKFTHVWESGSVVLRNTSSIPAGAYEDVQYATQGESKIYEVEGYTRNIAEHHGEIKLQLSHNVKKEGKEEGEVENENIMAINDNDAGTVTICAKKGELPPCSTAYGNKSNLAWYRMEAYEPAEALAIEGDYGGTNVYIAQEKTPEVSYNSTSTLIKEPGGAERVNVLLGHDNWLSPTSGAFEFIAHDPGIGVSLARVDELNGGSFVLEEPIHEQGKCLGVQCPETYTTPITYNPSMANGEDQFELYAEDEAGLWGQIGFEGKPEPVTVKVNAEPPHNLEVSGWSKTREISAVRHTLTVEATAGAPSTPRPGVKSIAVSVDGGPEISVPSTSCPEGPCTASGKYTLDAESLTEGVHRLTVTATDYAGNVAAKPFTFDVRHGSPVPVGPGTVDPTTGQFKLSATDVSLAGSGGVSRVYQSRNLTAGAGGPLGPQWAIGLGGGEGLTVLPTGGVVLNSSAGATTTFTPNEKEKGQFESPLGDGNVKIEAKEEKAGKGITEYLLKETVSGATTTFKQPAGTAMTTPLYSNQFGGEGADLSRPVSDAIDSSANVWVTDWENNRIMKFSPAGVLLGAYGGYGPEAAQFIHPWGIAINQSTGNVYVTDWGNNRVEEFSSSGTFIKAMGWGVKDNGNSEYQICTAGCKAGIAGSGKGQFNGPYGIAVDSSGDIWVADTGNNRVEEFNEKGELNEKKEPLLEFGSAGTGADQFNGPAGFAFSGGNVYVSDQNNNRVQEFSSSGTFIKMFGWDVNSGGSEKLEVCTSSCKAGTAGLGNGQFSDPRDLATDLATGNLYAAETYNDRVQELSTSGTFIAKFGSAGSGSGQFSSPIGVAVSSSGGIYVADYSNARVQEWTRPSWLPVVAEGPSKNITSAYEYKAVEEEGQQVIEPTEALASQPAGVTCGKPGELKPAELKKGCRALTFEYAKETTAKGEGPSEWGNYNGHLEYVEFHAWNPSTGAMSKEELVAKYSYDKQGRLRGEWDPRISPSRKATYGYDAEGHVTAVNPPGQEPWLIHYGASAGDPNTGRLLSVTRPAAASKTVLKEQEAMPAPVNTSGPTLSSTSPEIGVTLKASSEGKWSNSPLAYSYQWEDCYGSVCSTIPGAVNQSYTPQARDAGYDLVVQVSADNANGVTAKVSAESKVVATTTNFFEDKVKFGTSGSGKLSKPAAAAVDSSENVWVADTGNHRVVEFSSTGAFVAAYGWGVTNGKEEFQTCTGSSCLAGLSGSKEGEFKEPTGIVIAKNGYIYVADAGNTRIEVLSSAGKYVTEKTTTAAPAGIAVGKTVVKGLGEYEELYVIEPSKDALQAFEVEKAGGLRSEKSFGKEGTGEVQFKDPTAVTTGDTLGTYGNEIYVSDTGNDRVEVLQPLRLEGVGLAEMLYSNQTFGKEGKGEGQFSSPGSLAFEPEGLTGQYDKPLAGHLFVTDTGNNRVQEVAYNGYYEHQYALGSGALGIAFNTGTGASAGDMYLASASESAVVEWVPVGPPNPLPEPPTVGTNAVTTLEYNVPVSGTGLPNLTKAEAAKWGQKDDPTEAMAIFPPVKPMGWPAKEYERATIEYMDEEGRTVNVASPSGGVATTEYNEANEVERALSADNRATALKESTEAAQIKEAERLETKSTYNTKGQLAETLGPEHEVKVAKGNGKGITGGSEVPARDHVVYSYDEGSPEGKTYNLVTKTVNSGETASKEEFDPRETTTSYGGQENLGWELRKPTSVTTEPGGLNLRSETLYEKSTGNVVETRSAKGSGSGSPVAPVYLSQFGSTGTAGGQFKTPVGDVFDASGDLWVTDNNNARVQEFSSTGTFIKAIGWGVSNGKSEFEVCTSGCEAGVAGSGEGQFSKPEGIAINQAKGNVYVVDKGNNRIEEFEGSTGKFVRKFGESGSGKGQLSNPWEIAITPTGGEVWVSDAFNQRVNRFSETGSPEGSFGSAGSGNGEFDDPDGIAFSDGDAYVVDNGNQRVQEFSMAGKYVSQFGTKGTGNGQFNGPEGIAVDPVSGDLYVVDDINGRIEEFNPNGTFLAAFGKKGSGNGELSSPQGVAVNSAGDIYVADTGNNRIEVWEPVPSAPVYASQFGSEGSGNGQFHHPFGNAVDSSGNVWVADGYGNRIEKFSSSGTFLAAYGKEGSSKTEVQFKEPCGIAINQSTGDVYVGDSGNNRVVELSSSGALIRTFGEAGEGNGQFKEAEGVAIDSKGNVWVTDYGNDRVQEFNEKGEYLVQFGSKGSGNGQFSGPDAIAISGGNYYVSDNNNGRVEEFNEKLEWVRTIGSVGSGNGQFKYPGGVSFDSSGNLYVTDTGNNRVQEFTPTGTFLGAFGLKGSGNGQFSEPSGITVLSSGIMYIDDAANNRVQDWTPAPRPGNEGAHDTRTAYYSAEEESGVVACRKHPEWADLPCQTEPVAQTGVSGAPELPVTTIASYNMWDEVEKTEEKFGTGSGAVTRTKTQTYDPAGRALTSEEKAEPATDTALPKVTNEYNGETGALEKQSAMIKEKSKTITSVLNTLGQLEKYTDAEGNTLTYVYNLDGQVEEVNDGQSEKKGVQTYAYAPSTGYLEKLVDSSAGTFTATHDGEGKMLTDNYPNGMTAKYTYNTVGRPIGLEYKKEKDCASKCPETWFSDAGVPSIHGETLTQASTLSKEGYLYDKDGRLTETEETPTGKGCKSRLYAYDEESNRTSEVQRESSTETCVSEGGLLQAHSYDSANHLIDAGVKYETFGNTLTLPEADAEGHELTSTYYVDNQVAGQTQNEKTIEYVYDSAGRTMEAKSEVKSTKVKATAIPHYSGPGEALTWTSEEEGKKWSRNIPGIDGALDAIEKSGEETKPLLQLHDLQGNIVGTAALTETETKLLSTYNSTEFGVPNEGKAPPPYAWLGAGDVASEFSSGVSTEGGASYVPQIARSLQTAPVVPPGAFPNGDGTGSENTAVIPGWSTALANQESANTLAAYTAKLEAEKKQKEKEAGEANERRSAERAEMEAVNPNQGGVEEEGGEEEGLIVTGQYAQPSGGGGSPMANAAGHKRKNECTEHGGKVEAGGKRCRMKACGPGMNCKPKPEPSPPPSRNKASISECERYKATTGPEAGFVDGLPPTEQQCEEYWGEVGGGEPPPLIPPAF